MESEKTALRFIRKVKLYIAIRKFKVQCCVLVLSLTNPHVYEESHKVNQKVPRQHLKTLLYDICSINVEHIFVCKGD